MVQCCRVIIATVRVLDLLPMLVSMPTTKRRTTLAREGDVLPIRRSGEALGLNMTKGDFRGRTGVTGEITEAPPPLVSSPQITSLMMSQALVGSSVGEVGVFTSQMVINFPLGMTSSAVDSGMTLTCRPASILPVVTVILELSSLVVMVTTLPEAVS